MNRKMLTLIVVLALGLLTLTAAACGSDSPTDSAAATPDSASNGDLDDTVSSADPTAAPEPTRSVPADMVQAPAPIESVTINVAESFPPQYFVEVVSGLPNACVEFYNFQESRDGNAVTITVTNLQPGPEADIACAEVYETHRISVPLGSDFQSGETYTVDVNGTVETFVAQ